jgi:hypothetical protein
MTRQRASTDLATNLEFSISHTLPIEEHLSRLATSVIIVTHHHRSNKWSSRIVALMANSGPFMSRTISRQVGREICKSLVKTDISGKRTPFTRQGPMFLWIKTNDEARKAHRTHRKSGLPKPTSCIQLCSIPNKYLHKRNWGNHHPGSMLVVPPVGSSSTNEPPSEVLAAQTMSPWGTRHWLLSSLVLVIWKGLIYLVLAIPMLLGKLLHQHSA